MSLSVILLLFRIVVVVRLVSLTIFVSFKSSFRFLFTVFFFLFMYFTGFLFVNMYERRLRKKLVD
jgi:hypothetical protein